MDTSWWLALGAVVVIALVAAVADGWARAGRRPRVRPAGRTRPPGRPGGPHSRPTRRPEPGDIWWAEVPYEDGPPSGGAARGGSPRSSRTGGVPDRAAVGGGRSKDRPCLVLSVRGEAALVAKITSKYRAERAGVIALPPGSVGDARGRASFLETDELRDVPLWGFRRRVGAVDPLVWDQVRHLAA
ncbi:type II toxin-antitoxin system PemK/MazF family toxin [Streptomyces sp. MUM 203J]|uniref:type II toxin-antitoxin system PemK/MazF family toxin n=1 Tax=Streptomyces sp. MUM 203J TaxID=2791990 RepID=UPI001F037F45|nr:type II toxin-antitoxin system PemK/MazF family toxin [Streptomyces sp. MUM 203J]MCH0540479.1 type II toxin-antitoxin system PemK/MazF family toxin [Streptomyces sp. MUM 203J]